MKYRKSNHRNIFELLLIFISSIFCGWLFFLPAFWELTPHSSSTWEGLDQIFIHSPSHSKILGGGIDHIGTIWMFSMVDAMLKGQQSTYVDLLYHPIGFDLGKNTGFAWADAWVSWPIIQWLGTPQFYHLHLLCTIAFSMSGIALILRKCDVPILLAIALSMLSIMQPFVITEFYEGRPTQIYLLFHCLMLYGVVSILQYMTHQKSPLLPILLSGIGLSGACLTYWFGGVAIGFCAGCTVLLSLCHKRISQKMIFLLGFSVLGIGVTLLITWRISSQMLLGKGGSLFPVLNQKPLYEIDLWLIKIPIQEVTYLNDWHELYAIFIEKLSLSEGFLLFILLAFLLFPLTFRKNWVWGLTLFFAFGIPMTSAVTWNGGWLVTGHALLESIFPPLTRCHVPERMVVAPILIGVIFGGLGIVEIKRRIIPVLQPCFVVLLSMVLFDVAWHERPQKEDVKFGSFGIDETLLKATNTWDGGIIDVPLLKSQQTYVQIIYHKKPILGGPGLESVRPQNHRSYVNKNAFLRMVEGMAERGSNGTYTQKSLQKLYDDGFGILAVHENLSRTKLDVYREMCNHQGIWDNRKKILYLPLPKLEQP